ncbi:MAG: biotin--[acetyl-CoA-carboxylase] ligase [Acidimicrobiia bacterium]|nr:biotin--[acetyl-CoA-carboxylase] ligase [Acidimicrobiia bacterium]
MTDQRVVAGVEGSRFSSIVHIVETGSTNADLLAAAQSGMPEGAVLVTDHQTAGRGRQARVWHDDPGNAVLVSVLLRPAASSAGLIPLLYGLAASEAVESIVAATAEVPPTAPSEPGGGRRLALKWPNDLLVPELGERKLAGILAEATNRGADGGTLGVVVGMGLNLRWGSRPPDEIAARAATLEELTGRSVERWDVVRSILAALERWLIDAERHGPATVLDAYRDRCCTLGRAVRLQRPADVIEGVAVAVDDSGALVVETANRRVTVTAGDAHHL